MAPRGMQLIKQATELHDNHVEPEPQIHQRRQDKQPCYTQPNQSPDPGYQSVRRHTGTSRAQGS